jgi:hypothetical protein
MQSAKGERPPGLKPALIAGTYAALKGRSRALHAFVSFSAWLLVKGGCMS